MTAPRSAEYLTGLVRELCNFVGEVEWVEFKRSKVDPQEVGEYISALSNAAALNGKAHGYVLWGIDNETHDIIGTDFDPGTAKKGNEALESWLLRLLNPKIHFRFDVVYVETQRVVVLEIERATHHPVSFKGTEYIRIGEVKKPLKEASDRERRLWQIFDQKPFEGLIAAEHLDVEKVLSLQDYPSYFDLLGLPLPLNRDGIVEALSEDNLIRPCSAGGWDITNLGVTLLAKRLADFPSVSRKASRLLKEAIENNKIVVEDPTIGTRSRAYLPFWASQSARKSTGFV